MDINKWCKKWGVPLEALGDLRDQLSVDNKLATVDGSEADVQVGVRLEASAKGVRLWRNNVGACLDDKGNFIRYGLANDSKAVNDHIKSSDLIGIRPIVVGGVLIGQFVARECKRPGWVYKGTEREQAQLRFLELVASFGGDAAFTTGEGSI